MQAASETIARRRVPLRLAAPPPHALALVVVTLAAGALRLWSLHRATGNAFYDAAVRSMAESWHNFFFAAFEPSAGVSIDKPPVDLWLQVASVKLLGFTTTALILPQAVAGTLAVPLLYDAVRRLFGWAAALASAACLALLPISVLTARSDTMDSLMMALNVLALWLVIRAVQAERLRLLLLAGAVMGIAFEVKLLEALFVLPALGVLWLAGARVGARARVGGLAAALAVFVALSLAWPVAVSLAPTSHRPYTLGSTNGSVWNAIFVFNGLDRVTGKSSAALLPPPPGRAVAAVPPAAIVALLGGNGQAAGPLRLLQVGGANWGERIGIELAGGAAFGLIALAPLFVGAVRRRTALESSGAPPLVEAGAFAFAVWLLVGFASFSFTHGVIRARYLEGITPAVAVALGTGTVASVRLAARNALALAGVLVALALTAAYAVDVSGSHTAAAVGAGVAGVGAALAVVLARRGGGPRALVAAGALALAVPLIPAAVTSVRFVRQGATDSSNPGSESPKTVRRLSAYLGPRTRGVRYELAVPGYSEAGPIVIHDGRPVLVLMNFHRPVVSVPKLAAYVRAGELRYALIPGHCGSDPVRATGGCPATIRWLRHRSIDVTRAAGLPGRGMLFRIARR